MTVMSPEGSNLIYALVDANCYYCSCERAFNPKLATKPIVVLSNNRGCVVARSNEAKALGVKMGTPWFQLKELADRHGIIGLTSNYTLYSDMSNRVVSILRQYSPHLEVYSIDESFIGLNGMTAHWNSLDELGQNMRRHVHQWTNLPVAVGFGKSKTLAKLASFLAKKNPDLNFVCDLNLLDGAKRKELFQAIDVGEVWGVGQQLTKQLKALEIHTVFDLTEAPIKFIRQRFGVVLERTVLELNGISCIRLEEVPSPKKQIISSRSFSHLVLSIDELKQAAVDYMTLAAEKLRRQNSVASAIQVHIMTNRFRTQDEHYSNGIVVPLPEPSNDTRVLIAAAMSGLERIYRPGYWYKKLGVMLLDIDDANFEQTSIFEASTEDVLRASKLMKVLDSINANMGRNSLTIGATKSRQILTTSSDDVSPRYTTCWNELPIAFAY